MVSLWSKMINLRSKTTLPFFLQISIMLFISCNQQELSSDLSNDCNNNPISVLGKTVYGNDDTTKLSQIQSIHFPVFGLITKTDTTSMSNDSIIIKSKTIKDRYHMCGDDSVETMPSLFSCSGFLIADNLLVTASHCVTGMNMQCKDLFWYNYFYDQTLTTIKKTELIRCQKILYSDPENDLVIMKVQNNNHQNVVEIGQCAIEQYNVKTKIHAIGYPAGGPATKSNGSIIEVTDQPINFFRTDIDSFTGNSGSPVFDSETGRLVGMLVGGESDLIYDTKRGCYVQKKCIDVNSCSGELVLKQTYIFAALNELGLLL